MAEAIPPSSGASGGRNSRGLTGEMLGLLGSFGSHLHALLSLAGLEGREALGLYVRLAIVAGAAIIFALFGYLLMLLFVAFVIAHFFAVSWIWISLGLAVIHLLAALGGALYVRGSLGSPVFAATSAELRKDFATLKDHRG